jgi:hypothetical protein
MNLEDATESLLMEPASRKSYLAVEANVDYWTTKIGAGWKANLSHV